MSEKRDIIVVRACEEPIPLPTPEVKNSSGSELIEVTVGLDKEHENQNINGSVTFDGNVKSHFFSGNPTNLSGQISEPTPIVSKISNTIPVVVGKSTSSIVASKVNSISSNATNTNSTITVPTSSSELATNGNSSNQSNADVSSILRVYIIACVIGIIVCAFVLSTYGYDDVFALNVLLSAIACINSYSLPTVIFWNKLKTSAPFAVLSYVLGIILLFIQYILQKVFPVLLIILFIYILGFCVVIFSIPWGELSSNDKGSSRSQSSRSRSHTTRSHH